MRGVRPWDRVSWRRRRQAVRAGDVLAGQPYAMPPVHTVPRDDAVAVQRHTRLGMRADAVGIGGDHRAPRLQDRRGRRDVRALRHGAGVVASARPAAARVRVRGEVRRLLPRRMPRPSDARAVLPGVLDRARAPVGSKTAMRKFTETPFTVTRSTVEHTVICANGATWDGSQCARGAVGRTWLGLAMGVIGVSIMVGVARYGGRKKGAQGGWKRIQADEDGE